MNGIPAEERFDAFTEAYATAGFEICADASLEAGMEKICIYTLLGEPVHAARQLENGDIVVRDSNDPSVSIVVAHKDWVAFVLGVKNNEFDFARA